MKICFISHSAGLGGAERVLLETVDVLKEHGHDCQVILPWKGPLAEELQKMGIPYTVFRYGLWMAFAPVSAYHRLKAGIKILLSLIPLARFLKKWDCDLVYSNSGAVCVGALAAMLAQKPHIWHLHEFFSESHHGLMFLFGTKFSLSIINRLSIRCFVASNTLAQTLHEILPPEKLRVIYCSMHHSEVSKPVSSKPITPGRIQCLIVGTLSPGKRQEDAIMAMKELAKEGIPATLAILGNGDPSHRKYLEDLVSAQGVRQQVTFLGETKQARESMENADVILVCSRWESFGRVLIEAMFAGRPVIGARSGGTQELIQDGKTGLLYTQDDPKDLAEKIKFLYQNPQCAREFVGNAKQWVGSVFTKKRFAAELLCNLS